MLKTFTFIGFFCIYLSAAAQKAFYFQNPGADLNKYSYFYLKNSPMDAHELTNPYLIRKNISDNNTKYFILYNELSLKNLTIIDGINDINTLNVHLYTGEAFDENVLAPSSYKKKKIKGSYLIIDVTEGSSLLLLWRGWIELKKIKAANSYSKYQKAISLILLNFHLNPPIVE